jgi:hypothetical protein
MLALALCATSDVGRCSRATMAWLALGDPELSEVREAGARKIPPTALCLAGQRRDAPHEEKGVGLECAAV